MKLLRPFTGTGSVFFPIGRPPIGACEFATDECLQACYVNDDEDFDEETRISQDEKDRIYNAIVHCPTWSVKGKILQDLDGLQTHIFSWFGSGDCMMKDIDCISAIIEALPDRIVQMGFTRNHTLWSRFPDIFALTVDSKEDAQVPGMMYAIPDFETQTSVMCTPDYEVRGGFCGPILCRDQNRGQEDLTHYINCKTCCRRLLGCFDRRAPQ